MKRFTPAPKELRMAHRGNGQGDADGKIDDVGIGVLYGLYDYNMIPLQC